ncbi:MAG: NAD-binding protein [Paracoccaceae bacterium]|nr:NAD-binding protein [Paracoccaceae bacterium]
METVAKALVLASKAGRDPIEVRESQMCGFVASKILDVHGECMIKRTIDFGFRVRSHQRDLNLAQQCARTFGVGLPDTALEQEFVNTCAAQGGAESGRSGIVRALERLANHKIRKGGRRCVEAVRPMYL